MATTTFLSTGDRNFDYLFGGPQAAGIPVPILPSGLFGTSVLIEGFAGSGKTILACHLCTHALKRARTAGEDVIGIIYSLDQRPEELANLIVGFGMLRRDQIGSLQFKSEYIDRAAHPEVVLWIKHIDRQNAELATLWQELQLDWAQCKKLKYVVVDPINLFLRAAKDFDSDFRRLVDLSTDAKFGGVVEIMTIEKAQTGPIPEEYIPHVVIELSKSDAKGLRRALEIKKVRNQPHYIGVHDFEIKPEKGLRVFPSLHARSESIRRDDEASHGDTDAISFGDAAIDKEISPGLPRGGTSLLWGPTGTHKTNLCARFLVAGLKQQEARALFISLKIEGPALVGFLKAEVKRVSPPVDRVIERTKFIQVRDPFELPTSVFTRIVEAIQAAKQESEFGVQRAVVFGLRRLWQLPAFRDSEWQFLEVLNSYLHSQQISTLLVDWPEDPGQVAPPIAIDLCSSELRTRRDSDQKVQIEIRRKNYDLVGKTVEYST